MQPPAHLQGTDLDEWRQAHSEAIEGRATWELMQKVILLDYSHRCDGPLSVVLHEIMQGELSNASWNALCSRCLKYDSSVEARRQAREPAFTSPTCAVGVTRHSIRSLKTWQRARFLSAQVGKRLLVSPAADRCVAQSASFDLPSFIYKQFAAVVNLTTTKHLASVVCLWRGLEVVLEEKLCVELGVVRGARAVIDDLVFRQ